MNRPGCLIAALLLCAGLHAQKLPLKELPSCLPACVHADRSELHFPGSREAHDAFLTKLDSLLDGSRSNINIWHIGGSHVQGGHFSYRIMEDLAAMAPDMKGERGFIFPMRLAHTNSDKSFRTSADGNWECPMMTRDSEYEKPRYGITGFGATTCDSTARVSFGLGINADSTWTFNRLRVMGYPSKGGSAHPVILAGSDTLAYTSDWHPESYIFDLPADTDSIDVYFDIPAGESFTLTGFEPISGRRGINYYASGVNGARVRSWLDDAEDLERDLPLVDPDMCIFGLGINDSACSTSDFSPEKFKENYRELIAMIRRQSPDCTFIFITNNDSYRYVRRGMAYNTNARAVQRAMYELAREYDGAVFDQLDIMGGTNTVLDWRDCGLIKKDKLHFTREGYVLMADLLYNAIIQDYNDGLE